MWLTILSDQLPIVGLVSRYLTNYLMGREAFPRRELSDGSHAGAAPHSVLDAVSSAYPGPGGGFFTCCAPFRHWMHRCIPSDLHA